MVPYNSHTISFTGSPCNLYHEQVDFLEQPQHEQSHAQKRKSAISVTGWAHHNFIRTDFCNSFILYWYSKKNFQVSLLPTHPALFVQAGCLKGCYNPLTWIHLYKTAWKTKKKAECEADLNSEDTEGCVQQTGTDCCAGPSLLHREYPQWNGNRQ